MAQRLYHMAKVRSGRSDTLGIALAHPLRDGSFVAVFEDFSVIVNERGRDVYGDIEATVVDETREKWDALDGCVREILILTASSLGKKITAIKALRSLTGLGLTEAKRAIEEFTA